MRALVTAAFDGGSVAQVYPLMDLTTVDWWEFFSPLAELIYAAHPDAVWSAALIPEDVSDKEAMTGHAH